MTPVVRGVERAGRSPRSPTTVRDLADRARAGRLRQDELEGGSITVTNLGMYGTEEFAAIINPPQAAILAVGAAREEPVVVDGAVAVATVLRVTALGRPPGGRRGAGRRVDGGVRRRRGAAAAAAGLSASLAAPTTGRARSGRGSGGRGPSLRRLR